MSYSHKRVLYIGGNGKVGRLTLPLLAAAGHEVQALIRSSAQSEKITQLGAQPVVADLTTLSADKWRELVRDVDAIVWGAGAGGGSSEATWAVDRDAAMALIDALEELQDSAPSLLMISYWNSMRNSVDESEGSWYAYVESKKAVDRRLISSGLDHVILGPARLNDEPARGLKLAPVGEEELTTSRELVAQVVAELISRPELPTTNPLEFIDGESPVTSI